MTTQRIAEVLGGRKAFRQVVRTDLELERCVRKGLPTPVLRALLERAVLTKVELYRLVIPRRTLAHRVKKRERLSLEESNRASRVARIHALATETFGDEDTARRWLRTALRRFGGHAPMDALDTEIGASRVETLLGRIGHGLAA